MKIDITTSDQTSALAAYIRADKFFRAKNINGSNLRKLFTGLGYEIARAEGMLQNIVDNYDPHETLTLLSNWEKAIGIPDDCIPLKTDIDDRRNNVLMKLLSLGISTKEGFESLGTILGYDITVYPGKDALTFPYVFPFLLVDESAKWIMYIEADSDISTSSFPYTFPLTFGTDQTLILRCLIQKLVPSLVKVIFNFI